jgi:hypothetical protein
MNLGAHDVLQQFAYDNQRNDHHAKTQRRKGFPSPAVSKRQAVPWGGFVFLSEPPDLFWWDQVDALPSCHEQIDSRAMSNVDRRSSLIAHRLVP